MRFNYKYILYSIMAAAMIMGYTSCSDDEQGGTPVVKYVRVTDPNSSDSLLVAGTQGAMVAIIGENLGKAQQVWFNDQRSSLNSNFITNTTIITTIPGDVPEIVTNKMKIVFGPGDTLFHDFVIDISPATINSMSNEFAKPGETVVFRGENFFEPLTITFSGGQLGEIVDIEDTKVSVKVPEGAEPGPITFTTNFGTTASSFHYRDQRNTILNYDDLTAAGSWRAGPVANENGLDGNYLRLFGTLDANQRVEDNFTSQFWGNKRFPQPKNLVEGSPDDYVLKFEARVKEWYGSYLQICWGPYNNEGNQEVWSNLNGRGLWRPWEAANKNFSTNGEWITVTIPISEMNYQYGQKDGNSIWTSDKPFDPSISGTLSFWIVATPVAKESPVEVHIDNVRIVQK